MSDWLARTPGNAQPESRATFDPDDGLSLDEAVLVALVYNADLRLARLEAGVAEAGAGLAGRWDDPVLSSELLRLAKGGDDPWIIAAGLSITVPISGRLSVDRDRAHTEYAVALDAVAEAEWRVQHELTLAWLQWSATRVRCAELATLLDALADLTRTMDLLAEAGEMDRTEAALFAIELAQRKSRLVRMRGELAQQEQSLRTMMGLSPDAPIEFAPTLKIESTNIEVDPASLPQRSPTLVRLARAYDVAELTYKREIRKQVPDLTIGPAYELEDGQSKVGLSGSLPIPVLNRNQQAIAQAKAQRELARARYETEYEQQIGAIASAASRAEAVDAEITLANEVTAPLIRRQLKDVQTLLETGEAGVLVLLETIVRVHDTQLDLIDVQLEQAITHAQLRYLAGPMPDPASNPSLPTPQSEVSP